MTKEYIRKIYKLKDIYRYNSRPTLHKESVAEHSYYVALIALKLLDDSNITNVNIREKVLIKALLHDLPEIELNDITHDVKIKLNLYSYLEKYENEFFKKNYNKYTELMKNNEDNIVNFIVKIADIYSVLQYTDREIQLGNQMTEIKSIYNNAIDRLKNMKI